MLFGSRDGLADDRLSLAVDFVVAVLFVDAAGDNQNAAAPEILRQFHRAFDIGIAAVDDAVNRQAGDIACFGEQFSIRFIPSGNLDAVVSQIFEHFEFVGHGKFRLDHLILEGLLDPSRILSGLCRTRQGRNSQRRCGQRGA